MYGRRNGYLFQRMAVGENAVADMDDFVRNVDTCKAVASFECGIAEIDHGRGQRDRREGNTAGKTVAFELQQSLGELYFRQAFAIGKHLASQQDGIVGYGYAVKAVARTESGFTYTFECGGQGEFLQVVTMRKSVVLDVFHSFGQKNGGQTFTIGEGVLSYACQCVRKLDARQRLAVTEGLEADVSDTVGDDHFPDMVQMAFPRNFFFAEEIVKGACAGDAEFSVFRIQVPLSMISA